MFFQSKEIIVETDLYDQLKTIVTLLIHYECPSASFRHHILLTANEKLQTFKEAKDYHFKESNMAHAIGRFHKNAYEHNLRKYNQLQLMIDSYMLLSIEKDRKHINHRLRFHSEVIKYCYQQVMAMEKLLDSCNKDNFIMALKEDLFQTLANFTQ